VADNSDALAAQNTPSNHHDLEGVLDRILLACDHDATEWVSVKDVMETIGNRSFGPLLLVPGLIGLSPIGAIPGLPGIMAVIVIFVAVQILLGRDHAWLPDALALRAMKADRVKRAIVVIRPYARFVDRLIMPRMTLLTRGAFFYVLAAACLLVAIVQPVIELVPLAGIVPNAAIVAFALAITAHDGLWALIALSFTGASVYLIAIAF
jgi:hypothetical protein